MIAKPAPMETRVALLGTETFYGKRSEEKLPTSDNPENDAVVLRASQSLQLCRGDRLLDFGCADGYFLRRLYETEPTIEAYGVDLVEHDAWSNAPVPLHFRSCDLPLPFADECFTKIFSSQVLEHLADDDLAIAELCRVLAPNGRMWIATPNGYDDTWAPFHAHQRRVDVIEGHFRHFSLRDLTEAFGRHGCRIVHVNYDVFVGLYLYYRFVAYNPWLKKRMLKALAPELVSGSCRSGSAPQETRSWQRVGRKVAFALMRMLRRFDEMFAASSKCQVIEVLVVKVAAKR